MPPKIKKRKKTDKITEYSHDDSKLDAGGWGQGVGGDGTRKMNINKGEMTLRDDQKGIVKGKEAVRSSKYYNPGEKLRGKEGADTELEATYKSVKVGPIRYNKRTTKKKGGKFNKGEVKSESQTDVKVLGKSIYSKKKDIPNEDADKRYAKMMKKLKKRKKMQDA